MKTSCSFCGCHCRLRLHSAPGRSGRWNLS
ncbi:TPA: hypothetical protein ACNU2W_000730 [Aeromonas salmonicida subsp. pectinolytica]|uniref:4Fe-4S Mo/W bis-MGD-type domain-containing protein n=1 Tax=Escherichia coli TaxID=562 RepID=A0A3L0Y8T1_ECOLX|nr:hypothetical protein [Aeromonas bestiarum]ELI6432213.1 hypothetical protein [Aeromonas salmonicida subsp. salmonicida]HDX8379171.1 hypothetical protein [Aeromonas salmonicida]HEH9408566.1 hypothetical protein [Aeromonas salmonicida]